MTNAITSVLSTMPNSHKGYWTLYFKAALWSVVKRYFVNQYLAETCNLKTNNHHLRHKTNLIGYM